MPVRIGALIKTAVIIPACTIYIDTATGQCTSFPYNEGFETSDGGWFAGGASLGGYGQASNQWGWR